MYYLYRYIRIDKNVPFYIGIGTISEKDSKSQKEQIYYRRAYTQRMRNNYWKNIVSYSKYKVEIILESDIYEFIKEKEKEFIKLYKRHDKENGTLCKYTDGGGGSLGRIFSKSTINKMSKSRKGLRTSIKQKKVVGQRYKSKFGFEHNKSQFVICIETGIIYGSQLEACRHLGVHISNISYTLKKSIKVRGFAFEKKFNLSFISNLVNK
jgi:hypothetical protein